MYVFDDKVILFFQLFVLYITLEKRKKKRKEKEKKKKKGKEKKGKEKEGGNKLDVVCFRK